MSNKNYNIATDTSRFTNEQLEELENIRKAIAAGETKATFEEFYIRMINALIDSNCGRTDAKGTYEMHNEFDDAFAVLHGEEVKEHKTYEEYINS